MSTEVLTPINDWQPGKRPPFYGAAMRKNHPDLVEDDFWAHTEYAWPYTVCNPTALYNYYSALRYLEDNQLDGAVVECGVFFGGSIMFAGKYLASRRGSRPLIAFDTFYGFVRNDPKIDVGYNGDVVCRPNNPKNDFCEASSNNMRSCGYENLRIIKGDVFETIPRSELGAIAILRLDTDTYDTTKFELEQLYDRVVSGGVVIIDDYGFNVGCAKASEDFIRGKRIFLNRFDRWGRSFVKP